MVQYFDAARQDASGITLERFDTLAEIPQLSPNGSIVPLHQHGFYELTLIVRGSCEHFCHGVHTPLLPGDLCLLAPHRPHGYFLQKNTSFFNCQFEIGTVQPAPDELFSSAAPFLFDPTSLPQRRMRDLTALQGESAAPAPRETSAALAPRILHLRRAESELILSLLSSMLQEQIEQKPNFSCMKHAFLEQMLVLLRRVQLQQFEQASRQTSWKQDMVDAVLSQLDADIAGAIDFEQIAQQKGITLSYFRTVFKETTGLAPTDYLNHARILRALEMLQTADASVSEIAVAVGIYDANYFSRLFKKIIGYPPSYFKAVAGAPPPDAAPL